MDWKNGIPMTEEEEAQVLLVREAGCKCELPLLGYIPNQGPRCRMCGIEAYDHIFWPFKEGATEIWYQTEWKPFPEDLDAKNLTKTHTLLGTVEEGHYLENLFVMMQGENWSPEGEARERIDAKGLAHTSMSVGDCIVVDGKGFMVDYAGFKELK